MASLDWYNLNAKRQYPFQPTTNDSGVLPTNAILDCKFWLINPTSNDVTIYLDSMDAYTDHTLYTFKNSLGNSLQFNVPNRSIVQYIWNTDDPSWYGYCVFGAQD